jgi:hypothetical protein
MGNHGHVAEETAHDEVAMTAHARRYARLCRERLGHSETLDGTDPESTPAEAGTVETPEEATLGATDQPNPI